MTPHPATSAAAAPVVYVGCVWIVSRHLLVAQALAAALSRRVGDVRALRHDPLALEEAPIDPRNDLLLVVDDLRSPSDVTAILSLGAVERARAVVMTRTPQGPLWGALLEEDAIDVIAEPRTTDRLAEMIEEACAGRPLVGEEQRLELVESWRQYVAEDEELVERMATLSRRERGVLDGLAAGSRPAELATSLGVAESTVRAHIRSIRRKLGVDSQLRAVLVRHRVETREAPAMVAMPSPRRPRE